MRAIKAFIHSRPVPSYYALTFAISWGGFLLVGGRGVLSGSSWQTDPSFLPAVSAMLAGPPVAGVLMTVLVSGTAGLSELAARGRRWRVGARWYACALAVAPLVQLAVLLGLSRRSPVFLPAILAADNKASLLLPGLAIGLAGGLAEELGWTGFAIPRLWRKHGILATGLVVGILWTAWHWLQMWWVGATSSGTLHPALFLPQYFLSATATLTAYRVLMVWVYARTESLFVAILMHASYIFTTLFVLAPPTVGADFLSYSWIFAAALSLLAVGVVRSGSVGLPGPGVKKV